jgi:hypothetical protein
LALLIGEVRMSNNGPEPTDETRAAALSHLEEALKLLDKCEAPAEIGAYVDLAINRLRAATLLSQIERQNPKPDA